MEHKEGQFVTHDNTKLFYEAWIPESPNFLVIYLHGAAANATEGRNYAEFVATSGGITFAMDQRGWGRSSDRKAGHISNGDDVVQDVLSFLNFVQTEFNQYNDLPVVLAGHSMGGLIAIRVLIDHEDEFTCATISSPWIETRVRIPGYIKVFSGIISVIWPTFSDNLNIKLDELTHDNKVISQYYKDVETGFRRTHGTARWFTQMRKMQEYVKENGRYINLPVLIMQAGQDLIVKESASKDLYNDIASDDKKWQYYPNFYHECWNEEKREVESLPQVLEFIQDHTA